MRVHPKNNRKAEKINFGEELFTVVKFVETGNDTKLFECIPDIWFLEDDEDGERRRCYWPPKSKQSFTLRAMNRDVPDEDWTIYECEVVSGGHGKTQDILVLFSVFRFIRFLHCSYVQHWS